MFVYTAKFYSQHQSNSKFTPAIKYTIPTAQLKVVQAAKYSQASNVQLFQRRKPQSSIWLLQSANRKFKVSTGALKILKNSYTIFYFLNIYFTFSPNDTVTGTAVRWWDFKIWEIVLKYWMRLDQDLKYGRAYIRISIWHGKMFPLLFWKNNGFLLTCKNSLGASLITDWRQDGHPSLRFSTQTWMSFNVLSATPHGDVCTEEDVSDCQYLAL